MSSQTLNTRIALKIDTSTNWASSVLVLLKGEIGIESDTRKFKIGDGSSLWSALPYAAQLPNKVDTKDPTTSDTGYEVGTFWLNSTDGKTFILQSNESQPTWVQLARLSDITGAGLGDMHTSDYDKNSDGSVDKADSLKSGDSFLVINDSDTTGLWTAAKISSELANKANTSAISDMLTKTEASSTYATIENTYNKSEVDTKLNTKSDKTYVNEQLALKANAANTYNKSEVDGFLATKANSSDLANYIPTSAKGTASGVASLDESGKVPSTQLPSYVDDVVEYENKAAFPDSETAETGKIYVDKETNKTYRWGGTDYVEISASLALGETAQTAFAGDRGKTLETKVQALETTTADLGALATKDTVSSAEIDASAVIEEKIANNAVTTNKIADGNITNTKLAANSVTTEKITDSNVTEAKIADNAVTSGKLVANAVTTEKIANDAVTNEKIASLNALKLTLEEGDYLLFNCGNATA